MTDIITQGWTDYALLDSGEGRKLEKFGPYTVDRPEPQAMWSRRHPALWDKADAVFAGENDAEDGRWNYREKVPETFPVALHGIKFHGRFTAFRHMGYFPEQLPHWDWMLEKIKAAGRPKILNLFAYTGVASLLAAKAGAEVTHVDASKKAISWAAENQKLAGLDSAKIRWIVDDARKFTAREARRSNKYTGILVDPPKFGRGPDKELWELFDHLKDMLALCNSVLEDKNAFVILTTYAVRASHHALDGLCREAFPGARCESGELVVREKNGDRNIATSLYCRVTR